MISDAEQKIIKEGEGAHAVYAECAEWEKSSKNVMFEIKTRKGNVADLQGTVEKESGCEAAEMVPSTRTSTRRTARHLWR